jgi:hypothetical protein
MVNCRPGWISNTINSPTCFSDINVALIEWDVSDSVDFRIPFHGETKGFEIYKP